LNLPGEARVTRFGWSFGPGDKMLQVVSDYEKDVLEGDLGLVRAVDIEARELAAAFDGCEAAMAHAGGRRSWRGSPGSMWRAGERRGITCQERARTGG
jgi:hypothetical protein